MIDAWPTPERRTTTIDTLLGRYPGSSYGARLSTVGGISRASSLYSKLAPTSSADLSGLQPWSALPGVIYQRPSTFCRSDGSFLRGRLTTFRRWCCQPSCGQTRVPPSHTRTTEWT